jgi:hypothetical protein
MQNAAAISRVTRATMMSINVTIGKDIKGELVITENIIKRDMYKKHRTGTTDAARNTTVSPMGAVLPVKLYMIKRIAM